ncbi:Eukaryotic translation initiation factor 3 subunit K [Eufriesea mexicana]|uniref:Eukaryotic translation initiation factor 3 subunit K n=1 Tax=Eufriesea mexicana TaxID=516756 RepID=A0A310ST30_9HYME|nr:Eukaryotic translation initiation factor 3 subunit K [Eufriesea mexicana]
MAEAMRQTVAGMLKGIERYNPDHLATLEKYVEIQSRENAYDLEANLAVLKLYQLNPHRFNMDITCQILLKALTNLPHTDFVLCKCLLSERIMQESPINQIMYLADILEQCNFQHFWDRVLSMSDLCDRIVGFQDSIRKFVCHVVGITFQTIDKNLLAQLLGGVDGTHLFGKYNVVGFGKETSIKLDDSYHKPEKVIPKYVNCFFYNGDYSAYVPLCFLLPGYLEIGLPAL